MRRAKSARKHNILLVKDDIGKAKPTTRRMPPQNFVYGKPEVRDTEDASAGKSLKFITSVTSLHVLGLPQKQPTIASRQGLFEIKQDSTCIARNNSARKAFIFNHYLTVSVSFAFVCRGSTYSDNKAICASNTLLT